VLTLAAGLDPAYDVHGGAISDLGVMPGTATLFNVSLVAVGLLNFAAGALLFRGTRRRGLFAIFALSSLGAVGAGVFPLSSGGLHSTFALVAFVGFNLEAIACASLLTGAMRFLSVAAGAIGLAFVALMVIGDGGNPTVFGAIGHGGAERMIVYPVMLWMIAFGGALMGKASRSYGW
jgi:hypothetical membrane protein